MEILALLMLPGTPTDNVSATTPSTLVITLTFATLNLAAPQLDFVSPPQLPARMEACAQPSHVTLPLDNVSSLPLLVTTEAIALLILVPLLPDVSTPTSLAMTTTLAQ